MTPEEKEVYDRLNTALNDALGLLYRIERDARGRYPEGYHTVCHAISELGEDLATYGWPSWPETAMNTTEGESR